MTHPESPPRHRVGKSKKSHVDAGGICERTGKRCFPTERDAVKAAAQIKSLNARKKRKALPTIVYQCPSPPCRQWHLTRGARGGEAVR